MHGIGLQSRARMKERLRKALTHYVAAGFSPAACLGIQAEALYYGPIPVAEASLRAAAALLERLP